MAQCQLQALLNILTAFHLACGDRDDTEDNRGVVELFEQLQVIEAMRVFDRYLLHAGFVNCLCELEIAIRVRLQVTFIVDMTRVAAAHMHNPRDLVGQAVKAAVQAFDSILQCFVNLAYEQGFVNLDVLAAGTGERPDFVIEGVGQIEGEFAFSAVINVGGSVDDRQRTRDGDLERPLAECLSDVKIPVQKMAAVWHYPRVYGRQLGNRGAISMHLAGQVGKVDTVQVAAMVVDVVLTTLFTVGGDIDATFDLILDRLTSCAQQELLGYLAGLVIGIGEGTGYRVIL